MTLRELREECGKSRAEVAAALGVTVSSFYNYENGWREINIRQVLILSNLYHFTAEEIIQAQLKSGGNKNARD